MKTKILIGIVGAMLMPGLITEAQISGSGIYRNDDAGIVINNYYNYDFHYSSRINRFHRSFVNFEYYSPVFTDVYWYSYQPYTWGLTIYGGARIGIGVTYNYPVYYTWWDYPWSYGWDYAWYGGSFYWGYTPLYVSWYTPVVVNVSINRWWPGTYYSYHVRNRWYSGDYRPVYNTYNYYYYNTSGRYDAGSGGVSRRVSPSTASVQTNEVNRGAGSMPSSGSQRNTGAANQSRRNINTRVRQGDQGNNNSLDPGNTNNVNRGVNSGNNPGRRNVHSDNGNVHQGDRGNNNSLNPGNTDNVNRGVNSGNNPGRKNVNNGNQDHGNAGRNVISMPSNSRVQSGVMTPSRPGETRSSGRSTSVSTGRNVTQPVVSQSNRRTVSTNPVVRSSGNVSKSERSVSSGSSKNSSSGRSDENKSSSSRRR